MNDPWVGVLQALEPTYFKWKDIMEKGPHVSPEIWQTASGHCALTLQEVWEGAGEEYEHTFSSSCLDDTIEWAVVELEKWQCKRTAYDTWQFKSIQDAEKFKTLFLLKQS
jgi:hypothetical protein